LCVPKSRKRERRHCGPKRRPRKKRGKILKREGRIYTGSKVEERLRRGRTKEPVRRGGEGGHGAETTSAYEKSSKSEQRNRHQVLGNPWEPGGKSLFREGLQTQANRDFREK